MKATVFSTICCLIKLGLSPEAVPGCRCLMTSDVGDACVGDDGDGDGDGDDWDVDD